jgi:hypothetical protein
MFLLPRQVDREPPSNEAAHLHTQLRFKSSLIDHLAPLVPAFREDHGYKKEMVRMPKDRSSRGQPVQSDRSEKSANNPVMCKEGKGVRNFACIFYDACLDRAAKGMWSGFSCRECSSYTQKDEEEEGAQEALDQEAD